MGLSGTARRRGGLAGAMAVAAAAALVGMLPAPAHAGISCTPLIVNDTVTSGPSGDVALWNATLAHATTTAPSWSVVAARGSQGSDVNVALLSMPATSCSQLNASADPDWLQSDWVAFDNNAGRLPIGTYAASYSDAKYIRQFVAGGKDLATNTPTISQPIGYGDSALGTYWIVDIRDVRLTAGTTYKFVVTGGFNGFYLLHSTAADTGSWTATKTSPWAKVELPYYDSTSPSGTGEDIVRTATLTVTPTVTGWYGALVNRDGWWGPAVTVRVSS